MEDYARKGISSGCGVTGRCKKIIYFHILWSIINALFFGISLVIRIKELQSDDDDYEGKDDRLADLKTLNTALLGIAIMSPLSLIYVLSLICFVPLKVPKEVKKFWLTFILLTDIPCLYYAGLSLSTIRLPTPPMMYWFVASVIIFIAKLWIALGLVVCIKNDGELCQELEPFAKRDHYFPLTNIEVSSKTKLLP